MLKRNKIYLIVLFSLLLVIILVACSPGLANLSSVEVSSIPIAITEEPQPIAVAYQETSENSAEDLQGALVQVYQLANPSVVYIITASGTSGSGFVYDSDGHIVTNNHVIQGTRSYEVVFSNGQRLEAQLVGADVDSDLAVIQVDALPQGVVPLLLGDAESLQVGQFAVAIGNPFGEQGSMSFGIISGLERSLPSQRSVTAGSTYSLPEVIQTDAPINPGNSGGPLLNLDGEVIGVNAAIASQSGENSGVGFSIPVSAFRQIVPGLIKNGEYVYPYMGAGFDSEISLSELDIYDVGQTQGAYVVNVTPGGPGELAGLVAADPNTGRGGDLIIAIDGKSINDFSDLNSYLVFHASVGQTIELTVLRDGQEIIMPLTLGARP